MEAGTEEVVALLHILGGKAEYGGQEHDQETSPSQNTCRLNENKNPEAIKEERNGAIRTGI
jgi:hypothetical protein